MRLNDERWNYEFTSRPRAAVSIEDAETFLDLRALASLRVVAGPDKSLHESVLLSSRCARRRYLERCTRKCPTPSKYLDDDFHFSDLRVDKCGLP